MSNMAIETRDYRKDFRSKLNESELIELEQVLGWSLMQETEIYDIAHCIIFGKSYCSINICIGEETLEIVTCIECDDFESNIVSYVADTIKKNMYAFYELYNI